MTRRVRPDLEDPSSLQGRRRRSHRHWCPRMVVGRVYYRTCILTPSHYVPLLLQLKPPYVQTLFFCFSRSFRLNSKLTILLLINELNYSPFKKTQFLLSLPFGKKQQQSMLWTILNLTSSRSYDLLRSIHIFQLFYLCFIT